MGKIIKFLSPIGLAFVAAHVALTAPAEAAGQSRAPVMESVERLSVENLEACFEATGALDGNQTVYTMANGSKRIFTSVNGVSCSADIENVDAVDGKKFDVIYESGAPLVATNGQADASKAFMLLRGAYSKKPEEKALRLKLNSKIALRSVGDKEVVYREVEQTFIYDSPEMRVPRVEGNVSTKLYVCRVGAENCNSAQTLPRSALSAADGEALDAAVAQHDVVMAYLVIGSMPDGYDKRGEGELNAQFQQAVRQLNAKDMAKCVDNFLVLERKGLLAKNDNYARENAISCRIMRKDKTAFSATGSTRIFFVTDDAFMGRGGQGAVVVDVEGYRKNTSNTSAEASMLVDGMAHVPPTQRPGREGVHIVTEFQAPGQSKEPSVLGQKPMTYVVSPHFPSADGKWEFALDDLPKLERKYAEALRPLVDQASKIAASVIAKDRKPH